MSNTNNNLMAIADIYSSRASDYDSSNDSLHVRQTQYYINYLKPYLYPGISLLDLACGTGLLTFQAKHIIGSEGHVVGVDISKGMLDIARQKSNDQGQNVSWYEHDISDLSALDLLTKSPRGKFDLITCASALILLPNPTAAIMNWMQFLRPGGRIMADVMLPRSSVPMEIFGAIGSDVGQALKWDMMRYRTQASVCKVFEDAGLDIEKVWESEVFGSKQYDVADGDSIFENVVKSPMFEDFGKKEVRNKAKVEFVRKLKELGGIDGKVKEEVAFWMCIARKPGS